MSQSIFSAMFIIPAIPESISGKNDVAIKGQSNLLALAAGEGSAPEMRGKALLALIAECAFDGGGVTLARMSIDGLKGNKRLVVKALIEAGALPACKGGKTPRPLLQEEVNAWLEKFALAMGERAEREATAPKLPAVEKFLEKYGKGADVRDFALAIVAACGGSTLVQTNAEPPAPVKMPVEKAA